MERSARISALHREQLSDIAEFDHAESWRGDGAISMVAWVTAQCGVSTSTAKQWVRSAVKLESLPCLAEGLASGDLSLDLVEPLAEVASPSSDAALREASVNWSVRQARELAAWHGARAGGRGRGRGRGSGRRCGDRCRGGGRCGRSRRRVCGTGVRAPDPAIQRHATVDMGRITKDDYAAAKSSLVGSVTAAQREREENGGAAPASDPVGVRA